MVFSIQTNLILASARPVFSARFLFVKSKKDTLFNDDMPPIDFVFDEKVADVFDDMINRSVPGYGTIISMIGLLAQQYCRKGSNVYDLGCSLGAATMAIKSQVPHSDYQLVAVDSSPAMIEKLETRIRGTAEKGATVDIQCADLLEIEIKHASVVVLNFTLQFIPLEKRNSLIDKVYQGMNSGGILILSEKIKFPDENLDKLFMETYHTFKENMGYSRLEISQKRAALENVLVPETIDTHKERALKAGFKAIDVWFQCFNFASLVAFK